jgi:hypothetical protein
MVCGGDVGMKDTIDVKGASGAAYRFVRFSGDRPLSPMGGNFLLAREGHDGCEVLYVGEAANLMTDAKRFWERAVVEHGASDLFTRLNVTGRVRLEEQADILAALDPPLNAPRASEASDSQVA